MASALYGSIKFDAELNSAKYVKHKLAYLSGVYDDLELRAAADTTDAKTDTGFAVRDGEIVESLWESVATAGGAIVTVASSHTALAIAATATDNQTNIGAEIAWFCDKKGFWKFSFLGSELGSGAINATFATS